MGYVDTLSRLNSIVGKNGSVTAPVQSGEIGVTFLAVCPAPEVSAETDIQTAITRSQFTVRFDNGTLLDGSNTKVISGFYISEIRGPY
jgi:hypothetical protein